MPENRDGRYHRLIAEAGARVPTDRLLHQYETLDRWHWKFGAVTVELLARGVIG